MNRERLDQEPIKKIDYHDNNKQGIPKIGKLSFSLKNGKILSYDGGG